ncbi:hypothetical protein [Rhodoferax fermentans]|uniref:Uncharacterized protein n=1 Tax=Rhodoferax fermentans TaxID=28066 RepID=A0A1T1ANU2_RHOFE|nr:hypothetical protein [Rhodoferax fermentans]MBK1685529.1 hypothetical protein [Rhodoferax fermentans]OOV05653.1 hypothetical protein RF819_02045 [Rhodoferax fermentans]
MREFDLLLTKLGEADAIAIMASIAPASTRQAFTRYCSIVFARQLLVSGLAARAVQFRIAARYSVDIKTAQRRVKVAIAMGPR